jgi:tetratricopeptide (TPR) repeat protein
MNTSTQKTTTVCPVAKFKRIAMLTIMLFAIAYVALSQTKQIDSIKQCIGRMQDDTSKANTLNELAVRFTATGNYDSALNYAMKSVVISEQLSHKKGLANASTIIGYAYSNKGNYPSALDYYFKALKIYEEQNNKEGIAKELSNIGIVFMSKNDFSKSLEYYNKALKIYESTGNKKQISNTTSNIGIIYGMKGDLSNALTYFLKSLKILDELGEKNTYNIITNIGLVYMNQGDYGKALDYFFKALSLNEKIGDKNNVIIYSDIASTLIKQNKFKQAEIYCKKALYLSKEIGSLEDLKESNFNLSELYNKTGNKTLALDFYKQFITYRDSLNNEENTKSIVRSEMNFDFDKKQAIYKLEQEKHDAVSVAENKRQRTVIYGAIIGLIMVVVFSVFLFNRFRVTKKQNNIIKSQKVEVERQRHLADEKRILAEEQKFVIEEKQKEIIASIRYAKRIQDSLLPTEDYIQNTLNRLIKTN